MSEKQLIKLLYNALREYIAPAVAGTRYDVPWIVALVNRECGWKVARELNKGRVLMDILVTMRGDYVASMGGYQGYSPFQIDIKSYPDFIKKGNWKNLQLAAQKCVAVLEEKRRTLELLGYTEAKLGTNLYNRCITAAYNCGAGSKTGVKGVAGAMRRSGNTNPDLNTYDKDYSKEVFRMIGIVWNIVKELEPQTSIPEEIAQANAIDGEDREVSTKPRPGEPSEEELV